MTALLWAGLMLAANAAWAGQVVGVISQLSGPLLDRKSDGSVKVLAVKSEVENGDVLVSEKNTYAQIRFADNSEITLKPGTTFRIENFAYDAGKPEADSATFSLVKGGLRSITGLLGKRNKEKFALKTPNATIGIRGTTFIATYVPPVTPGAMRINPNPSPLSEVGAQTEVAQGKLPGVSREPGPGSQTHGDELKAPVPDSGQAQANVNGGLPGGLTPGLHLSVTDGAIVVTNTGGSQLFSAGQFGYVPGANQAPVIVPPNGGLQFVPPPSFGGTGPGGPEGGGGAQDKPAVDCVVR